jgi:hypothetical protein
MWLWIVATGLAAEPEVPDEGDDLDVPVQKRDPTRELGFGLDKSTNLDLPADDDIEMVDFVAEAHKKAPPPTWFHVNPTGKTPLADNFDVQIVSFSEQYVVVQLPVLVSTSRAAFVVEHPNGLQLAAEIECGPHKLVQRQEFSAAGVLLDSPTLAFFEAAFPVAAKSGAVRFVVRSAEGPAPEDPKKKVITPPPALQDRFARTTVFVRP